MSPSRSCSRCLLGGATRILGRRVATIPKTRAIDAPRPRFQRKAMTPGRMLNPDERIDWLRRIRTDQVGPVTFYQLLQRYGSAAAALDALPGLARRGGR